jgi:hypothetical protein
VPPASGAGGARLLHPSLSRPLQLVRASVPLSLVACLCGFGFSMLLAVDLLDRGAAAPRVDSSS